MNRDDACAHYGLLTVGHNAADAARGDTLRREAPRDG